MFWASGIDLSKEGDPAVVRGVVAALGPEAIRFGAEGVQGLGFRVFFF